MAERRYETLILLEPELGEAGAQQTLERITALFEEKGATVDATHDWGVRDMAYLIANHKRAHFGLVEFHASPATLAEVERNLRLMDPVLRFLSVRQDPDAPPATELRTAGSADGRGWGERREGRGDERPRRRYDDAPGDESRRVSGQADEATTSTRATAEAPDDAGPGDADAAAEEGA